MSVGFTKVIGAENSWFELELSVKGTETLRLPVVFRQRGSAVVVSDDMAAQLLTDWIKERAAGIAIFGTIGMRFGQTAPAVTINVDREPS